MQSLFTLLSISTFDSWGEIMARAVNSDVEEKVGKIKFKKKFKK